jgi:hypothetical protein
MLNPPLTATAVTSTTQIYTLINEFWSIVICNAHASDSTVVELRNALDDVPAALFCFRVLAGTTFTYSSASCVLFDTALRITITGGTPTATVVWRKF